MYVTVLNPSESTFTAEIIAGGPADAMSKVNPSSVDFLAGEAISKGTELVTSS